MKHWLCVAACAMVFLVCGSAHLLVGGHYYVVNYDSFWFHHLAKLIIAGDRPGAMGSGLAYPLAALARLVGLQAASIGLPLVIGLGTGGVLYFGVRRLFSKRVALLALVCYTFALPIHFYFLAGNVDRDSLHFLLVTPGLLALALYWREQRPVWLGVVFASIGLLALEWGLFGLAVYLPLLIGVTVVTSWDFRRWQTWVVLGACAIVMGCAGRVVLHLLGWSHIAELYPVNVVSILEYATIIVPLGFGVLQTWRTPRNWLLAWLVVSLVMGCFALRLAEFGIIAGCILGGIGLEYIWEHRRIWLVAFAVGAILFVGLCWKLPANMTMPPDWQEALEWVSRNTPQDARVMAAGDYAHWIEDIGEREAEAAVGIDNDREVLAAIYTAADDQTVATLLHQQGCEFLMMSARERNFPQAICTPPWPYYDALAENTHVVYHNDTVYVLAFPR